MAFVEPMDVDIIGTDFDDKENSLQNSNVLPRTPCTEKGYEELDVSELNMKLRYSITPASSPMSRSYTANSKDNKILNQDNNLNTTIINENCNLTRSLNSTLTKSPKLPLQALPNDQFHDSTITSSIRRSLDADINNCTIMVSGPENVDENLSLPSTSSSCVQTPEATTPTKDIPKDDGGSPIMRGLKSVLNMFRSSQSPIPPEEINSKDLSSTEPIDKGNSSPLTTLASTPINTNKNKENNSSKRNSPLKDSVTFNDDLERELQWKDETIIFKQDKISMNKLVLQQSVEQKIAAKVNENLNTTVEYMDMSYSESFIADKTVTDIESKPTTQIGETISGVESDSEFVDCETIYMKNEEQSAPGLSVSIPLNIEHNKNNHDCIKEVSAHIDKENQAVNNDLKKSINIICEERHIEKKLNDVNILNEATTSNVSESNFISTDMSDINNCSISHGDVDNIITDTPVLDEIKLNMAQNDGIKLNKDTSDFKNESNLEVNKNNKALELVHETLIKPYINDNNDESELGVYLHDATTPLNIITDYQENVPENNSVNDDDTQTFDTHKNSSQHFGLLKECDIENSVNKTTTIHESDNEKYDDITNILNITDNIKNANNEYTTLDTEKIIETNIREPTNEESSVTTNKLPNIENSHSNDLDVQNLECSELKQIISDSTYIGTDMLDGDQIDTNSRKLENKIEILVDTPELKELPHNETRNMPFDIPLPLDEDSDKSDSKEVLVAQGENSIVVPDDDVVTDILAENSNIPPEAIHTNDNILSDLPLRSIDLEENTGPKEILGPHIEITNEIQTEQDCINSDKSSVNIVRDNIEVSDSENSNVNAESFNSVPNKGTCELDIQMNIDDCTNNRQSVFDDKSEKSLDIQEEKLFCHPMETATVVADEGVIMSSNNDLHVSVENLNNQQDDIELENIENPFDTKTELSESPSISPTLGRKGYNINFDEIDDPFATKTNIRTSPPPLNSALTETPKVTPNNTQKNFEKKRIQLQNRRKSQPVRKNQSAIRKPFNSSFDSGLKQQRDEQVKSSVFDSEIETKHKNLSLNKGVSDEIVESNVRHNLNTELSATVANDYPSEDVHQLESNDEIPLNNITKVTSEKVDVELDKELQEFTKNSKCDTATRNVFNLPEIDDVNFNPFATKSRVCQSPPSIPCSPKGIEDKIENKVEIVKDITLNIEQENTNQEHEHLSPNVSTSYSLKNTDDKENTIREVQTEDEDTIEGPFFEADELNEIEKMSDFESNKCMEPFEDFPVETESDKKEELFIDAEAFEFLLNQNKSNVVTDSGKESLFLKFDPLFAKRVSSDGVLSALNRIQKRQSTPKKLATVDKINEKIETTTPSSSTKNLIEEGVDEASCMPSKPMMVVNPAVNSLVSPRKSTTPPRINRRSLTFTSPAMAVIDRLLSLSGNTSLLDHDTSTPQVTREYNDTDIALTQLRELLAEKEIHVHNLRSETKELKQRLDSMESQVKSLEKESDDRLKKVNELNNRLAEKTKMNKSMSVVVEEYERTIASLIAEMDQEKRRNAEERARLISERDEQTAHLASMEVSFSDLHSKYEKSKQIILSMKANEDTYKRSIKDFEDNLIKMQKNYELLKQHATSKLNHANQELEKYNRSHEAEVLKLNAMIKRKELHITSLEESLTQKTKANEELTAICDELINKVG